MREVRAEDPELSPTTDERLTEELRDVVGTDRVRVAADRPRATRGQHPHQHGMAARFDVNGLQLLRTTAIVLTFGAVVALITRDWWVLPLAAGVHALGTMAVTLTIIRLTTTSEHPSPTVAAAMAEEGVSHGQPSRPTGAGGAPDAMVWVTMISLLVVIIVVPPLTSGGWMWLLTAVMVPLLIGWAVLQRVSNCHDPDVRRGLSWVGAGRARLSGIGLARRVCMARGRRFVEIGCAGGLAPPARIAARQRLRARFLAPCPPSSPRGFDVYLAGPASGVLEIRLATRGRRGPAIGRRVRLIATVRVDPALGGRRVGGGRPAGRRAAQLRVLGLQIRRRVGAAKLGGNDTVAHLLRPRALLTRLLLPGRRSAAPLAWLVRVGAGHRFLLARDLVLSAVLPGGCAADALRAHVRPHWRPAGPNKNQKRPTTRE